MHTSAYICLKIVRNCTSSSTTSFSAVRRPPVTHRHLTRPPFAAQGLAQNDPRSQGRPHGHAHRRHPRRILPAPHQPARARDEGSPLSEWSAQWRGALRFLQRPVLEMHRSQRSGLLPTGWARRSGRRARVGAAPDRVPHPTADLWQKNDRPQCRLDVYWLLHNFVRTHFTTKQIPAVALGIVTEGLSNTDLFRLHCVHP